MDLVKNEVQQSRKVIITFLIITLFLSSIVWFLTLNAGNTGRIGGKIYGYGIMWCPALATYLTCKFLNLKISDLAWKWAKTKYLFWSFLIPLLYGMIAYSIIWLFGWGSFYNTTFITQAANELGWSSLPTGVFIVIFFIVFGITGMFASMSTALGEEIGWRGFLVPNLYNVTNSYTKTSFLSGSIWALWHYPLLIFGDYNNGAPAWYGLICFTVMVISMSFIFTWFTLKSGSLWTAVILHASHNLFIQGFFSPITISNKFTPFFSDEFGVVVAAITLVFAIYFWTRRGEIEDLINVEKKYIQKLVN